MSGFFSDLGTTVTIGGGRRAVETRPPPPLVYAYAKAVNPPSHLHVHDFKSAWISYSDLNTLIQLFNQCLLLDHWMLDVWEEDPQLLGSPIEFRKTIQYELNWCKTQKKLHRHIDELHFSGVRPFS